MTIETEVGAAGGTRRRTGGRTGPILVVIGAAALAAVVLPFVLLREEPAWSHLVFHVVGIGICLTAVLAHRRFRAATGRRALVVLSWVCSVALLLWTVGHLGELFSVLGHGGLHAGAEVFEEPVHTFFASVAVPAWLATVVTALVFFVTVGVRRVRTRGTPAAS